MSGTQDAEGASLSTREAAKLLNVSVQTVQRWVDRGHIRAWKTLGGHRRIDAHSFDHFRTLRRSTEDQGVDSDARPPSLLIVEDDDDLRDLLQLYLSAHLPGAVIHGEADGFSGLVGIGRHKPDVVIADLNLPAMDGFRMISSLRSDPENAGIRIIVITSLSADEIRERGGLPPEVSIYFKPIDRKALVGDLLSMPVFDASRRRTTP